MLWTTREGPVPPFVGADLTDGTARSPRPVDVCGLAPGPAGLVATFWEWRWSGGTIGAVAAELAAARCAALDGPHALAAPGCTLRGCERHARAAGKTPDARDKLVPGRPFAGFVASSLELFAALDAAGLALSPARPGPGIWEVYPAHLWRLLAPGLAPKATARGRRQRAALLSACGVRLPGGPHGHDRLDAALCALAAAAACGAVPGLCARTLGEPLSRRADGTLEEGPMLIIAASPPLTAACRTAAADGAELQSTDGPRHPRKDRARLRGVEGARQGLRGGAGARGGERRRGRAGEGSP